MGELAGVLEKTIDNVTDDQHRWVSVYLKEME